MRKVSVVAALALAASSLNAAPIEELIKGASINGNSFMRYISNSGKNNGGQGYVARLAANFDSGKVDGFSFNVGLLYHYGATPSYGRNTDGYVAGSRADRGLGAWANNGNVFGLASLYAKYSLDVSKTTFTLGKMGLATPISNAGNDRGVGALVSNSDVEGLTFTLGFFDSWVSDNQWIGGFEPAASAASANAIGNNISLFAVKGDFGIVNAQLWYFNIYEVANSLFGEISAGDDLVKVKAQVAYTDMFANAKIWLGSTSFGQSSMTPMSFGGASGLAKTRGLYTLQVSSKPIDGLYAKVGFVGSFGQGYGVALNNEASFSKGGKYWFDNYGNGANGFSLFGVGGRKNSSINLWYLAATYKYSIVTAGLDIAGIDGSHRYKVSTTKTGSTRGPGTNIQKGAFFEITPSIDVDITKKAKFSLNYSFVFGKVQMQRIWSQVSYKF